MDSFTKNLFIFFPLVFVGITLFFFSGYSQNLYLAIGGLFLLMIGFLGIVTGEES